MLCTDQLLESYILSHHHHHHHRHHHHHHHHHSLSTSRFSGFNLAKALLQVCFSQHPSQTTHTHTHTHTQTHKQTHIHTEGHRALKAFISCPRHGSRWTFESAGHDTNVLHVCFELGYSHTHTHTRTQTHTHTHTHAHKHKHTHAHAHARTRTANIYMNVAWLNSSYTIV